MTYDEIVEETYISPIRSVVAVDDEFPTLDGLYSGLAQVLEIVEAKEDKNAAGAENTGPDDGTAREVALKVIPKETVRAGEILAYCRKEQWLVDIHDGSAIFHPDGQGGEIIRHLHQTDLLILDYQLRGEGQGGESAIRVLRALALNPHFNIVIVYTKKEIAQTFREIALGLLKPVNLGQEPELAAKISDAWDDWLAIEPQAIAPFEEAIDSSGYIRWRSSGAADTLPAFRAAFPLVGQMAPYFGRKLAALAVERRFTLLDLIRWQVRRFESRIAPQFDAAGLTKLSAKPPSETAINWLHSENLFVTVISKKAEGSAIIEELKRALADWRPPPHQLILSQMRAKLEASGGAIEQKALEDAFVQSGLLWQMLEPDGQTRLAMVSSILDRQWVEVWSAMKGDIVKGAGGLLDTILEGGRAREHIVHQYYPRSFDDAPFPANPEVWIRLNSYWSTQPVGGRHLTTGHIFELNGGYWVCLSPSCDLVPEQGRQQRWRGRMGGELHFKALKLVETTPQGAIDNATKGICVYLRLNEVVKVFGFIDPLAANDANPDWEQMIALDEGVLDAENRISVRVISKVAGNLSLAAPTAVTIVGQLRYEYALNLLQRLGQNLTRIGLDFVKPQ